MFVNMRRKHLRDLFNLPVVKCRFCKYCIRKQIRGERRVNRRPMVKTLFHPRPCKLKSLKINSKSSYRVEIVNMGGRIEYLRVRAERIN